MSPYYSDPFASCNTPLSWHGLYSGQTALLTPDSFAHPAKMAPALVFRIFDHLAELGLLKPDDTVLDPMAGTGLTGLAWAAKGGRSVLVELEPRFVGFIEDNKAQLARTLGRDVDIEVLQGDARHLTELLGEQGLKAVTSPPYGDALGHPSLGSVNKDAWGTDGRDIVARRGLSADYGTTDSQIGQERQEDYLSAMRLVYAEIAKVADVLVVVTKNPTRAGKLRRLDLDTIALLETTGWEIHCQHQAILFEETEQGHMFEGSKKQTRGRLSFFKRLSYQKGGFVARWEDIICAVRIAARDPANGVVKEER